MMHHLTFKSRYVVYLITCLDCGKQYVGKTSKHMYNRHGGHRMEIEERSTELGVHFANCGLDNLSLQIIDCVREGEDEARAL